MSLALNRVLWGQIFPWTLLGSAWSCLVLVRNDQKTFIYVFEYQGTGENNALDDNDEDSYDSWDDDDDKNCGCADDYQLISTSNCRQQPLHSKSFFNFLFLQFFKAVRIVAQSFSISTPHERQVFIFFKRSEGKEIAKNSRWVSKQIGRRGFFKRSWWGK